MADSMYSVNNNGVKQFCELIFPHCKPVLLIWKSVPQIQTLTSWVFIQDNLETTRVTKSLVSLSCVI